MAPYLVVVFLVPRSLAAPAEDTGGAGSELVHGQARQGEGIEVQRPHLQAGGDGEQRSGPGQGHDPHGEYAGRGGGGVSRAQQFTKVKQAICLLLFLFAAT